jgi:hypothetical protein
VNPPKAIDYAMSDAQADALKGATLLPFDIRQRALQAYLAEHGPTALIDLFAQFIGLANSVVASNREMIEIILVVEGGEHPYSAEKANLPTIFGALCGVALANSVNQKKLCHGCAFRLGTAANQSPVTTCDADYAQSEIGLDFMCHEKLDDAGNPKAICAGYAQRRRAAA